MTSERGLEIPSDFSWREMSAIKAKIPVPAEWYSREETMPEGMLGYFFAREPIVGDGTKVIASLDLIVGDTSQHFKTGVSLYVHPLANRLFHRAPSELAKAYISKQELMEPKGEASITQEGPLTVCRRFFGTNALMLGGLEHPPMRFYIEATGNDETGTFYLMNFETPAKRWKEDRDVARAVINNRVFSPET